MQLNKKVAAGIIAIVVVVAAVAYYAGRSGYIIPFILPEGKLPSTATLSIDGIDLTVYDETRINEVTAIDWSVIDVGTTESAWHRKSFWFFVPNGTDVKISWFEDGPDWIENQWLFEMSPGTWLNWNQNVTLRMPSDWVHVDFRLKIHRSVVLPDSFAFDYYIKGD